MSIEIRRQFLQSEIAKIHAEGEIAPPNTWISKFSVTKPSGKRYVYYRLMESHPSRPGKAKMVRYLGTKKSAKYKRFVGAIARRNRLQELERLLKRLDSEVSGANQTTKVKEKPPLTHKKVSRSPLKHLQTQLENIMAKFTELLQLFHQEKQERERLAQKLEMLINSV